MNILFTAVGDFLSLEAQACLKHWTDECHLVERMPMGRITGYLRLELASTLALVDAIVCAADNDVARRANLLRFDIGESFGPALDFPVQKAVALAKDVRNLPEKCTMRDGRKWNSVPFVIFCGHMDSGIVLAQRQSHAVIHPLTHPGESLWAIQRVVDEYHDRVLNDFNNLGMLVRVEKGRALIGAALRLKGDRTESDYYHASGDRRTHHGWVTIKRDNEAIRQDIELFQMLLDKRASETEMHRFFEEHPAILTQARMGIPISHAPRFANPKDNTPDFSFSPILGPWDAKAIELMELKGPAETTLLKGPHRGFSAKVNSAVNQIRDYGRYLRRPDNLEAILRGLGYVPDDSKLAVLIGRAPTSDEDREVWAQRQSELNVEVVTYDEILATQEKQVKGSYPYKIKYGTPGYPLSD